MQLELFSDIELLGPEQAGLKAKMYTANSIKNCSSFHCLITDELDKPNKKAAFILFNEAFRNYGFLNSEYGFCGSNGKGVIKVKGHSDIHVSSKELFEIILKHSLKEEIA